MKHLHIATVFSFAIIIASCKNDAPKCWSDNIEKDLKHELFMSINRHGVIDSNDLYKSISFEKAIASSVNSESTIAQCLVQMNSTGKRIGQIEYSSQLNEQNMSIALIKALPDSIILATVSSLPSNNLNSNLEGASQISGDAANNAKSNINSYSGVYASTAVEDNVVGKWVKFQVGNDYKKFVQRMAVNSPVNVRGSIVFGRGCQAHECNTDWAAFEVDISSSVAYAIMSEDNKISLYGCSEENMPESFKAMLRGE